MPTSQQSATCGGRDPKLYAGTDSKQYCHFYGLVVLRMADVPYSWCLIFSSVCIFLSVDTKSQTLKIITDHCDLIPGNQIELKGTFPTVRTANVIWQKPDGNAIASCAPPNGTCNVGNGVSASQEMGINYTLLILAAEAGRDVGLWKITDAADTAEKNLTLSAVNLTSIQVNYTGPDVISSQMTVPVNYRTECVSTNVTLTYILQKDNMDVPFPTPSSAQQCTGGFEFTTNVTLDCQGLNGNYTLCYVLKEGTCSYTQPLQDCIPVQCPETTTTASLPTTNTTAETPCVPDPCSIIAVLIVGCLLVVAGISFLVVVCKLYHQGIWRNGVIVCNAVAAILSLIAVIITGTVFDKRDTCTCTCTTCTCTTRDICIAGSVLVGISAVTLAVAGVICFLKCELIKGSTVGLNNKPIPMDPTGNGKHKPTES